MEQFNISELSKLGSLCFSRLDTIEDALEEAKAQKDVYRINCLKQESTEVSQLLEKVSRMYREAYKQLRLNASSN